MSRLGSRPLFDAEFHAVLAALERHARRVMRSDRAGGGEVPRRGLSGTIFHDYRDYSPGDDPRRIDWNVYGRLGDLVIKLFEAEARFRLHVIVDTSPSMDVAGRSSRGWLAKRLAGGLAHLGLHVFEGARLVITPGRDDANARMLTGKPHLPSCLQRLESAEVHQGSMAETLGALPAGFASRDATLILSDLFDLEDLERSLRRIGRRTRRIVCVQILDPIDLAPERDGWRRVRDVETGRQRLIRLSSELRDACAEALREHEQQVSALCRRYGARRLLLDTASPFERAMLRVLEALA
ncbi:MAG: DUF58 domain-containing protein [Planctomycetota bacterium]